MDTNSSYVPKEREQIIEEMEGLYKKTLRHFKYLKEVNKTLKEIDADLDKMEKYYFSEWIDDYNHFASEKSYKILLQDPIHNSFQDIHAEKMKILKKIVSKLQ